MKARLGLIAFCLYAAAQIFASFPGEFLPEQIRPARASLHLALRQIGLSPGLEVFNGRLPEEVPKSLCVIALSEGSGGSRTLYQTEPCHLPSFRLIERTFDGFLGLEVLSSAMYEETPNRTERLNSVAKMLCQSRLFSAGEAERVAIATRTTLRDYASNELSLKTFWPVIWNCGTNERERADPSPQLLGALEAALGPEGGR